MDSHCQLPQQTISGFIVSRSDFYGHIDHPGPGPYPYPNSKPDDPSNPSNGDNEMSTPFDALTNAVTALISNHKALQATHDATLAELASRDQQAQALASQIASLTQPVPQAATPAPAPVYGRHAGDK